MAYEPQPGTIPFRAIQALQQGGPKWNPSTIELCDALGIETEAFSAYMRPAREHGLVIAEPKHGTSKPLYWQLGEGVQVNLCAPRERDEPLHEPERESVVVRPGPLLPAPNPPAGEFRAIPWEGKLLVTGMEIRDGVAIFEPAHVQILKRQTDWWKAEA